ncbi:AAA family ATPase [Streptomyces adustus]|uniref:AAA family ATPase n=1 Tax=Streptomyces adustus TaxID=1609272 RepID=A0A5N8VGN4_9ACTN|nr:AAA family ATPase [Streptomyces adustus]MPY33228.1 AAA family ATPase [Streptomyces adustus]
MENVTIPADLSGGEADRFTVSIASITLENGLTVNPPPTGVTVVVGGNNVGKSTLLRQVTNLAARNFRNPVETARWQLVTDIRFNASGDSKDLSAWLIAHESAHTQNGVLYFGARGQSNVHEQNLRQFFSEQQDGVDRLAMLTNTFMLFSDPWQRASVIQPQEMRENVEIPPRNVMHRLEESVQMLNEVREICREVFRIDLTLDTLARMIQLRVGRVTIPAPPVDAVSPEYRREVASLPPLTEQGDGIKSLIALILPLVTADHPIVLIDEPEAFLHPPQASALGRVLGDLAKKKGIQVILATHDRNLLTGLLASEGEVSIVRLDRGLDGDSRAHQLAVEDVRDLWGDPLLKYTNALDSLFHRLTIVAEADQDCRFYAAALNEYDPQSEVPIPPSDVLFIPSYGKAAIYKLVKLLRAISVPVVAVPDIDILNDESNISRLAEAYGADWDSLQRDYRVSTQPFRESRGGATLGDVIAAVQSVFSGREGEKYSNEVKREVLAQLRVQDSPWGLLKKFGELAFEGQAAVAAKRLLERLEEIGIVLVRVGELEKFAPTLGVAKGPGWLTAALAAGAHRGDPVREHIRRCLSALDASPQVS